MSLTELPPAIYSYLPRKYRKRADLIGIKNFSVHGETPERYIPFYLEREAEMKVKSEILEKLKGEEVDLVVIDKVDLFVNNQKEVAPGKVEYQASANASLYRLQLDTDTEV